MPAILINRLDPGNRGFLRALMAAIIFMILSGAILVSSFLAWYYPEHTANSNIKPVTLTGNQLYIAIGKGTRQGSKLIVNELIEDGTAVISSKRTRFNASNYPILDYKITGRNPGTDVVLYWRTITHNHQTLFAKLHWNSDYKTGYNLQIHPEWKGQITELGISIAGDLRHQSISIERLTFSPLTVKSLLLTAWSEWNAFEGWTHSSINVIKGMSSGAFLSPVVAAVAWCGLAIFMYSLTTIRKSVNLRSALLSVDRDHPDNSTWNVTKKMWDLRAVVAMFLIAWLALDGKWQVNLWRQLADTKYLFARKTHHEQHMAADDAELYAYAKRIKEDILPKDPVRIFILQNKQWDRPRLKLMYYLLPHNIYNFGKYPNPNILKDGDYILALNPLHELSYSVSDSLLHYDKGRATQADVLDQETLGVLLKVRNSQLFLDNLDIWYTNRHEIFSGRLINNPVVISGVPTINDPSPGVIAVSKNNYGRFQLRFQEWDYQDGVHATEQIPFLALEMGVHKMADGTMLETGIIHLDNTGNWQTVGFDNVFPAQPSLFLTPQTSSAQSAISVRANKVTNKGFSVSVNAQESKQHQPMPTPIAYLAIYSSDKQGILPIDGKPIAYQLAQSSISNKWRSFEGYDLRLQEEKSLDNETEHASEAVDIMMIEGHLFSQVVSNNEPDTVSIRARKNKRTR